MKDLGRWGSGGTPPKDREELWEGELPWISAKDFHNDKLREPATFITEEAADCHSRIAPADSILLIVRGMALAHGLPVAQTSTRAAFNQDLRALSVAPKYVPRFVYYALRGHRSRLNAHIDQAAHGTARLIDSVMAERVQAPGREAQQRIADFLDSECERIFEVSASVQAQSEAVSEWLSARRQALVTGRDVAGPRRTVDVAWVESIPETWAARRVGSFSAVKRGASPRPIEDPIYFDDSGSHGWVRISDVTASDKYLTATRQRLSELGRAKSVSLEPGQLIVSIAASIGKAVITGMSCCIHDGFVYLPELDQGEPDWLYHIFSCPDVFAGAGKLGTQLNLNTSTVAGTVVPVPPDEVRDDLCVRLDEVNRGVEVLQREQRGLQGRLTEYRDALITEAVTGKLDVTRLSDPQLDESARAAIEGEKPEVLSA